MVRAPSRLMSTITTAADKACGQSTPALQLLVANVNDGQSCFKTVFRNVDVANMYVVQAEVADMNKRLAAAHESLAQSQLDLGETQQLLQDMRDKAAQLESR